MRVVKGRENNSYVLYKIPSVVCICKMRKKFLHRVEKECIREPAITKVLNH